MKYLAKNIPMAHLRIGPISGHLFLCKIGAYPLIHPECIAAKKGSALEAVSPIPYGSLHDRDTPLPFYNKINYNPSWRQD